MALPPGINAKTLVFRRSSLFDGAAIEGKVIITAPKNVLHTASGRPLFAGEMVRPFTDGVAIFEELCPTDAPGLSRYGWTYRVRFEVRGVREALEPFDFLLFDGGPSSINGFSLMPVDSSTGQPVSVAVLTAEAVDTYGAEFVGTPGSELRAALDGLYVQPGDVPAGYTDPEAVAAVQAAIDGGELDVGEDVPDATPLVTGKVALLGDLAGTAAKPNLRTLTHNERGPTPTLTKLPVTIGTRAQVGLDTIYVPWLIRVPDSVFAAFPQYGRWRCYTSTDHDTADGGIAIGVCSSDDVETAANWSWLRNAGSPVMFKDGVNRQTETPCVVWNPDTQLFHLYYQIAVGTTQTTRVATSANGVTGWTIVGDAIPNLPASVAGWNHNGYARVYELDGLWASWHLQGTGPTSAYGWSWSKDGLTFTTDRRRVGAAVHMTDGVLRFGISSLVKFRGELWAIGTWSEYVSGATGSTVTPVWAAPISLAADLRQLLARPRRIATDGGAPTAFATHPDGRLFGVTREGGASGSFALAVLA